jgi:hypothetical protein
MGGLPGEGHADEGSVRIGRVGSLVAAPLEEFFGSAFFGHLK